MFEGHFLRLREREGTKSAMRFFFCSLNNKTHQTMKGYNARVRGGGECVKTDGTKIDFSKITTITQPNYKGEEKSLWKTIHDYSGNRIKRFDKGITVVDDDDGLYGIYYECDKYDVEDNGTHLIINVPLYESRDDWLKFEMAKLNAREKAMENARKGQIGGKKTPSRPALTIGPKGGKYYMKKGRKVYV